MAPMTQSLCGLWKWSQRYPRMNRRQEDRQGLLTIWKEEPTVEWSTTLLMSSFFYQTTGDKIQEVRQDNVRDGWQAVLPGRSQKEQVGDNAGQ